MGGSNSTTHLRMVNMKWNNLFGRDAEVAVGRFLPSLMDLNSGSSQERQDFEL